MGRGTGQPIGAPLTGHTGAVFSVAFSPDGAPHRLRQLATTRCGCGTPAPATRSAHPLTGHTGAVHGVAFSPDGHRIVSGSDDNTVRVWDADTGQPGRRAADRPHRLGVKCGVQPRRAAASSPAAPTRRCGCGTPTPAQPVGDPLTGHTDTVISVAFSPDGTRIVSGSGDKHACGCGTRAPASRSARR